MNPDSLIVSTSDSIAAVFQEAQVNGCASATDIGLYITIIGTILTTTGLIVGLYTLIKVRRVAMVQKVERNLTQELLNVDGIESDLSQVINKLRQINDDESLNLIAQLSLRLGSIQGTRNVINKDLDFNSLIGNVNFENGFFCTDHIRSSVINSKKTLNIITGSTRIISGYNDLDAIKKACKRGVKVCIIGIDPNSPEDILNDATLTVSNPPPKDADEYRKMINETIESVRGFVNTWDIEIKNNFQFVTYPGVPRVSFIQHDNIIDLGFLHFFREVRNCSLEDRPYIRTTIKTDLGKMALNHFDVALKMGKSIF